MEFIVSVDFYVTADSQKDAYLAVEKAVAKTKIDHNILDIEES